MHVTIERTKPIASAMRLDVRVKRLGWRLLRFWLIADVFPVKTGQRRSSLTLMPHRHRYLGPVTIAHSPVKHQDRTQYLQVVTSTVTDILMVRCGTLLHEGGSVPTLTRNRNAAEKRAFSWHSHFFAQVVMEASDVVTETTTLVLQEAGSLAANQALAGPNQEDDELHISRRIGNRRGRIAGRKTIGHSCVEVLLASSR
jgi:hypothetical protein